MSSKLIDNLQKLGFTENEAKTYVGLLSLNEATAREIHEYTHVPRPRIYGGVLERIARKGYVEVREGTHTYFKGLDPEQLTEKLRKEFLFSLNETLKELDSVSNSFSYKMESAAPDLEYSISGSPTHGGKHDWVC